MFNGQKAVFLPLIAAVTLTGCAERPNQLEVMIPAGAVSVSYIHQSDFSEGVTFHVTSEPSSNRYIEGIRKTLINEGYTLCKTSALSNWTLKPSTARDASPKAYWISELYSKDGFEKLFMIRADGTPIDGGSRWRQGFLLAIQVVPKGHQDLRSIKNFCE